MQKLGPSQRMMRGGGAASKQRGSKAVPLLALLVAMMAWQQLAAARELQQAGNAAVVVTSPAALRAALLGGATRVTVVASPMQFNAQNWPDPPVQISQAVTILSPYRSIFDFCDAACRSGAEPVRAMFNVTAGGSLLLQRIFLREFVPATPTDLTGFGPVPALLSSGGTISFKLVSCVRR